jgi:hypothetical protein
MLFFHYIYRRILFGGFLSYQKVVQPLLCEHLLSPSSEKKHHQFLLSIDTYLLILYYLYRLYGTIEKFTLD